MGKSPIVMISSYPPRLCGIGTFAEEAREFIQKANPDRDVLVISHTDGRGDGVFPIIDNTINGWWKPVAEKIVELDPYVIHFEHEYGLYETIDDRGIGDGNENFLQLLEAVSDYPTIAEPHTVHGWMGNFEANFTYELCKRVDVVLFKCHYQKWRLNWAFPERGWVTPLNVKVVPHGARPDKRHFLTSFKELRKQFGFENVPNLSIHLVGLIGWIQSNKRWDILLEMWEEVHKAIYERTGEDWDLLAAGAMRDPNHKEDYQLWKKETRKLEREGIAHYIEFIPRGDTYYKMMAICDIIVLPSIDETQSGTLARIIALNKPYITTAPMEGLTAQTLESGGGLLFTNKQMLKDKLISLACNPKRRKELSENCRTYLENVVSWEIIAGQYNEAYDLAITAKKTGVPVELPKEF